MQNFLFFFLFIFFNTSFVQAQDSSLLIKKWHISFDDLYNQMDQTQKASFDALSIDEQNASRQSFEKATIEFKDSQIVERYYSDGELVIGTWKLSNNKLTLYLEGEETKYNLIELNSQKLVVKLLSSQKTIHYIPAN